MGDTGMTSPVKKVFGSVFPFEMSSWSYALKGILEMHDDHDYELSSFDIFWSVTLLSKFHMSMMVDFQVDQLKRMTRRLLHCMGIGFERIV